MTIRELRQMLTHVDNQEMTIRDLRNILFEIEDQEQELDEVEVLKITFGK